MKNKVFIATSLDGFIADVNGGIDWLTTLPGPTDGDGGFSQFMGSVDAIVMGRKTFEKVLSFGVEWPYVKMVFVWTSRSEIIPKPLIGKAQVISGGVKDVLQNVHRQGFVDLYIDGGQTIQSFLREGLIHELIITHAPIVLGQGIPLFDEVPRTNLKLIQNQSFDNGMVQNHYTVIPTSVY